MHNPPSPVTPRTPDSAGIKVIDAAGNFAYQRRLNQNKTIMNCFRDRTPSYSRSNSRNLVKYEKTNTNDDGSPETTVVLLKQPRMRSHNKLTLLKSSSVRDLSSRTILESNSSTASTSTSSSSASSTRNRQQAYGNVITTHCSCGDLSQDCMQRIKKMEQRINYLMNELESQRNISKNLEVLLHELAQRLEDLERISAAAASKKQRKRQQTSNATNSVPGISVQPSKFVAWMKLSNLWKQRPSIATLKEQNIYNDEPCFDTEIDAVLKHEKHSTIPKIVVDCCDLIEEKYRRSSEPVEGIYRICGDYNKIQTLRFKIDANDYDALRQQNIDIHTLTGVLKLFLREIKSPLVSTNEAKTFIGKPNQWLLMDLHDKIETLKRLIRSLPEVNRDTLEYLFAHFNRLTKVPLQQVSAETLSISITPSIFHAVQKGVHMQDIQALLREGEILADCVKIMIEYQSRIFVCDAERKQRRISVRKLRKTLSHPDLIFQNLF